MIPHSPLNPGSASTWSATIPKFPQGPKGVRGAWGSGCKVESKHPTRAEHAREALQKSGRNGEKRLENSKHRCTVRNHAHTSSFLSGWYVGLAKGLDQVEFGWHIATQASARSAIISRQSQGVDKHKQTNINASLERDYFHLWELMG